MAAHESSTIEIDPQEITKHAVAAVKGLHSDPDGAMEAFEQHFGPGSGKGLRSQILGGPDEDDSQPQTEGYLDDPSDGMADELESDGPKGKKTIGLSGGEFVIPADCCSDLGSGNSAAGAKVLESLVSYIRQMRHGTTEQPPQVDGRKLVMDFLKNMDEGD